MSRRWARGSSPTWPPFENFPPRRSRLATRSRQRSVPVARPLSHERLFGSHKVWLSRRAGERLRRRGRHFLRRRPDRPSCAQLHPRTILFLSRVIIWRCSNKSPARSANQAAPLQGWTLPETLAHLRRLLETRMGKRGKREFIQVLRLTEVFPEAVVMGEAPRRHKAGRHRFRRRQAARDRQSGEQARPSRSCRLSLFAVTERQDNFGR